MKIFKIITINILFNKLEDNKFKVIEIKDIVDVNLLDLKYVQSEEDNHPSKEAWEVVVPALIRELNL